MICRILPISFGAALQMTAVKLMNTLGGDSAALFAGKRGGDFFPRRTPLALFADEIHKRFQTAVEGASAAGAFALCRSVVIDDFWIHQRGV